MSDRAPKKRVTHTVEGSLRRDSGFAALYPDLVLLNNCPDHAFANPPFVSSAVVYTLYVSETETRLRGAGDARKMVVVRSSWLPRKHTAGLAREIYDEEELEWTADSARAYEDRGMQGLLFAHPESLGLRLLALHSQMRRLCQARDWANDPPFPLKAVLALSNARIRYVADDLAVDDPFRLCFRATHGLELPDMRSETLALSSEQRRTRAFYLKLKEETYRECHSLVDSRGLVDDDALTWLVANGVAVRREAEPHLIALAEVDRHESALLEALAIIENSSPVEADRGAVAQLASGKRLCDEQEMAADILRRKQVLAIDGRAGSGKSAFLNVVKRFYGGRIYCTAFQGVNAGHLRSVSARTSTTHRLLHEHARNHGPFKCALKGVEVLVIDEAGTQSLSLLAGLLSAFALCGAPRKKLVMVGDLGQLPPIGGPAPFRYLVDHFAARGYLVRFYHNHRADSDDGIVASNASAVRDGEPDAVSWDQENFVHCPPDRDEKPEAALIRAIARFDLRERQFIVLTHRREHAARLCEVVERRFGGTGLPGAQVGHKFAFTKNDYEVGAVNNEILTLARIEDREPEKKRRDGSSVTFKRVRPARAYSTSDRKPPGTHRYLIAEASDGSKREIPYEGAIVGRIKKASAVTSNAMQGSSREVVIRVDFGPSRYSTRERLYTDVTRAEKMFVYVGKREWFVQAVERPEPVPRSRLAERAIEAIE